LPDVTPSVAYSVTLAATGGTAPYTWSNIVGALPVGLSLNQSTGVISGTTTAAQATALTIQVVDAVGRTDKLLLPITVLTAPAVLTITSTSPLPDGLQGDAYSTIITATGGPTPYTWAVSVGALPDGLGLDPATGIISGSPTVGGTFSFTIRVTDNVSATDAKAFSLTIASPPPPVITTASLPNGQVGVPYATQLVVSGGLGPFSWVVSSGSLPPGFSLNQASGIISGTPTSPSAPTFTVQVSDLNGNGDTATLTLNVLIISSVKKCVSCSGTFK
jgi:hypothetical protein